MRKNVHSEFDGLTTGPGVFLGVLPYFCVSTVTHFTALQQRTLWFSQRGAELQRKQTPE